MSNRYILVIAAMLSVTTSTYATEPNETFATSTILSAGVLSVSDALADPGFGNPNTVLGVRDGFGTIYATDDNGSLLGDGFASALGGVPTNSGSIDFAISGFDDFDFIGSHSEQGSYEVFVDVYDFFGDLVDEISEVRLLQPGVVHEFSYSDFNWINGDYDVYIDNVVGVSDLDFFTFTGLTPGAAFVAETQDPGVSGIDTYLGWFDSGGALLAAHDDIDADNGDYLSMLEGTVPANGRLTFAVTGYGDLGFVGDHDESGTYALALELPDAGLPGDFNEDDVVDAADYVVWRKEINTPAKYAEWRAHFGETAGGGSGASANAIVPEPAALVLLILAMAGWSLRRHRST